jgi:hypothetical protein
MPTSAQLLQLAAPAAFLAVLLAAPGPPEFASESFAVTPELLSTAPIKEMGMAMGRGLSTKLAASCITDSCSWKRSALQLAMAVMAPHSWEACACTLMKLLVPRAGLAAGGVLLPVLLVLLELAVELVALVVLLLVAAGGVALPACAAGGLVVVALGMPTDLQAAAGWSGATPACKFQGAHRAAACPRL